MWNIWVMWSISAEKKQPKTTNECVFVCCGLRPVDRPRHNKRLLHNTVTPEGKKKMRCIFIFIMLQEPDINTEVLLNSPQSVCYKWICFIYGGRSAGGTWSGVAHLLTMVSGRSSTPSLLHTDCYSPTCLWKSSWKRHFWNSFWFEW